MAGASCRVGSQPGERSRLPGVAPEACSASSRFRHGFQRPRGDQGGGDGSPMVEVSPAFGVDLEGGERACGELVPKPGQHGPPVASARARSWMPGLWPISIADDTLLGRRWSRSRSCAAPAPYSSRWIRIWRASPSAGRMAASVWRVRSDDEHSTSPGRRSLAARWAANNSAARRPRGARGRSGSGRPGSSQLDLAWRSNQRRFTVGQCSSRSAVGTYGSWARTSRSDRVGR
jgi:hypothetical protein